MIAGIDVSHFNGAIDWRAAAGSISFAFTKATQGTSYVDPRFDENWTAMKHEAIPRGAYHFFDPSEDAAAQAAHFLSAVRLEPTDLPPVLDMETLGGAHPAEAAAGMQSWLDTVGHATGRIPIVYTSASFWQQLGNPARPGQSPLWVAHYGVSTPHIPRCWTSWTLWQFSDAGRCSGISGHVDLDRFSGTVDDLRTLGQLPPAGPSANSASANS